MKVLTAVKKITRPTKDSITLWFEKVDALRDYKPGQHLSVTIPINNENISRTYSFNSSPYTDDDIAVTIRKVENGIFSAFVIDNAFEGMLVTLQGPIGEFKIEPGALTKKHFVMFAAGSGITPIFSMTKSILHISPHSSVTLIYSNQSPERIIFRDELNQLENHFSERFKVHHVISGNDEIQSDLSVFYKGQLSKLIIKKVIKSIQLNALVPLEFYMCGPFGFMDVVEQSLVALNVEPCAIFKEHFYIPSQLDDFDFSTLPDRDVYVQYKGVEHVVKVDSGRSILEAALLQGLALPYSCKDAACGMCRSALLKGIVKLRKNYILSEEELKGGQVILCHGFPMTDNVIIQPLN